MNPLIWLVVGLSVATFVQTVRLQAAQAQRDLCASSLQTAAAQSEVKAAEASAVAVQTLEEKSDEDRPVVERVVTRVLRQCAPSDLPLPATSPGVGPASGEAQDHRGFAADLADDLETCQAELNRLDVLLTWVRTNGG